MKGWNFRVEKFSYYGLNVMRNFMEAPECECGCGESSKIKLDSNEELLDFMCSALDESECDNSAIFAIDYYGSMYAGVTSDEGMRLYGVQCIDEDFFAEIDSAFRLCCYALIVEIMPGVWKIVED